MWVGGVGIWLVRLGYFERSWERQGSSGVVVVAGRGWMKKRSIWKRLCDVFFSDCPMFL